MVYSVTKEEAKNPETQISVYRWIWSEVKQNCPSSIFGRWFYAF